MRIPVILFFVMCLSLCLFIISMGWHHLSKTLKVQKIQEPLGETIPVSKKPFETGEEESPVVVAATGVDTAALIQQIRDALNSDNPSDREMIFSNQLISLIKADPWTAARFAESLQSGLERTDLMRVVVQNWAQSNPADATKWVTQLADSNEHDTMLSCLCFQIAQTNPSLAVQTLKQQGIDDSRQEIILNNLVQQWASQDLLAAFTWAVSGDSAEQNNLVSQIALAESKTDPAMAAQIVSNNLTPGQIQDETAMFVLDQWAYKDAAGVTSWVNQLAPGELHDRAVAEISRITAYPVGQVSPVLPISCF